MPEEQAPEVKQEEVPTGPYTVSPTGLSEAKTGLSETLGREEKKSGSDSSSPLSSARTGLSKPSSSNEEGRTTAGPASRKRKGTKSQKPARERQKPGGAPTRKTPRRDRKKPDRLGFTA